MNPKKVLFWTLVFICLFGLVAICCLGCSGAGYHYREWDAQGNLVVKKDLDFLNFMVVNESKGVKVKLIDEVELEVATRTIQADSNGIKATGGAVGEFGKVMLEKGL